MKTIHRHGSLLILTAGLLTSPLMASAEEAQCKFSEPRELKLELAGAKSILFDVGASNLKVKATASAGNTLQGRACASSQDLLKSLTVTQKRVGDKLVVTLTEDHPIRISFGSSYSYLDLTASVPDDLLVQLDVGSGDASLSGAKAASADVGSGDAELSGIAGLVTAKVGSGDLKLHDIGALHVLEVGSGDLVGDHVRGQVRIDEIASGDLTLKQLDAGAQLGSIASGDATFANVTGDVTVDSIGSGNLNVDGVRGKLTVRHLGSGDIDQRGVTGTVDLPKER